MLHPAKYVTCLLLIVFASSCSPLRQFHSVNPVEVQNTLATCLPQLTTAPDDPTLFDSLWQQQPTPCPTLSPPYWLSPSANLPAGVKALASNNNVSITIFNQRLYVAFRTGPNHFASKKTGIYIISTHNGTDWRKEKEIFLGRDVREPFLIPINGQLHFYCFAAGKNMMSFEPDFISHYLADSTGQWQGPEKVLRKGEVHWSMKNRYGKTYLTSYAGSHYQLKGESRVSLFFQQTTDGQHFNPVGDSALVYMGGVSETAFEFDRHGNAWAVTRLEDGDSTGFGSHVVFAPKNNLGQWQFPQQADPNCYQSPKMFRQGNDLYLIARYQLGKKPFGKTPPQKPMHKQRLRNWVGFSLSPKTTALYRINQQTRQVEWVMHLPGAGDTAFPSIVRLNEKQLLVANYSSPVKKKRRSWLGGQLGRTGVYLQVITFGNGTP